MITVPAATPFTMPVAEPIVAIPGEPELHVPPPIEADQVVDAPAQSAVLPESTASGLTVTCIVVVSDEPAQSVILTLNESLPL